MFLQIACLNRVLLSLSFAIAPKPLQIWLGTATAIVFSMLSFINCYVKNKPLQARIQFIR